MSNVLKVLDDEIASLPKMAEAIRFAGAAYGWGIDESEPVRRLEEARQSVAQLIEALVPVEKLDVLRDSGVIGDDELVCLHGSTVNRIRAALDRVKGESE